MPVVIFKPALANRIAGTILPGVTGLLAAEVLLVVAEFLVGALVTKDFLLIAIVLSLISILTSLRDLVVHIACQTAQKSAKNM